MEEAALKINLHDRIEHADKKQLNEIYGLLLNYFNGQIDITEGLDQLPEYQQKKIMKGLEEADAGLGTSFDEVTQKLRKKYGLDG